MSISHSFNIGWEYLQKQGKMYDDNFFTRFKDNISEMFERGECDKGAKITADIVELDLQKIYPDDYTLP